MKLHERPAVTVHQLCAAHISRDLADAAETYPAAHWPVQVTQALQGLIHAANTAHGQGQDAVPQDITAYRSGVQVREHSQDPAVVIVRRL